MNHCTKEQLIAFENRIKAAWEAGELPFLLHLCGGNEDQLIQIFSDVQPGDWVFSGHRSHYHALLSGMSEKTLEEKIRRGDSMFVFSKAFSKTTDSEVTFITSSVLAGTCAIAVGVAWQLKQSLHPSLDDPNADRFSNRRAGLTPHVWCFLGDGAEEEGHFYEAVLFAHGHNLPVTFIIEDNDRQVDTDIATRRGDGWGFPIWPSQVVRRYHYTPTWPHAGSGCKFNITFQPEIVAAHLKRIEAGTQELRS